MALGWRYPGDAIIDFQALLSLHDMQQCVPSGAEPSKRLRGVGAAAASDHACLGFETMGHHPQFSDAVGLPWLPIAVEEVKRKIPIIVGTGTNNTKKVIEQNKQAEELKAAGVLIVNPYYNKGTQDSLVEHYKFISERTKLPIILYNVPSRTGMNILPETAVIIHKECKNVVAIKEASGNISQIAHLISIKPPSLSVLSGNDDQTLSIMASEVME